MTTPACELVVRFVCSNHDTALNVIVSRTDRPMRPVGWAATQLTSGCQLSCPGEKRSARTPLHFGQLYPPSGWLDGCYGFSKMLVSKQVRQ